MRGLRVALEMMENQGLENIWARTAMLAAATRAALGAMGLKLASSSPSDSVTGAYYPDGVGDKEFRSAMRNKYAIHIAGGQKGRLGDFAGKIFRLSHMGYVDAGDTLATLAAIETELASGPAASSITTGVALGEAAKLLQS